MNEHVNIRRCLRSVGWADQVVVVDSGSVDETTVVARALGATVVETFWRGFGAQREYALRLDEIRHDWILFVDADEWVSPALAAEIAAALGGSDVAHSVMFRLVFQGKWISHCGWYPSARIIRLMRRSCVRFEEASFSEHPIVDGVIGRLENDLVDEDLKGLARWMHKHVDYAALEVTRRATRGRGVRGDGESLARFVLRVHIASRVPARPLVQFVYMYILRRGFLDGRAGLSFCLYHAWFQKLVVDLEHEALATKGRI